MAILLTATTAGSIEIAIGIAETLTDATLLGATLIAADTIFVTTTDAELLSHALDSGPPVLSTGGLLLSGIADPGVDKNSLVGYQKRSLKLDHGQVQVATSLGMSVPVGWVVVSPAEEVMTRFEVLDVDGKIQIAARQGDVFISQGQRKERLSEGQQGSRNEADKCRVGIGAEPAAIGGVLDS